MTQPVPTPPYRTPAPRSEGHEPSARRPAAGNGDLIAVFAIVWIASVVRVALALSRAETFSVELTLVGIAAVMLPLAMKEDVRAALERVRRGRARRDD